MQLSAQCGSPVVCVSKHGLELDSKIGEDYASCRLPLRSFQIAGYCSVSSDLTPGMHGISPLLEIRLQLVVLVLSQLRSTMCSSLRLGCFLCKVESVYHLGLR